MKGRVMLLCGTLILLVTGCVSDTVQIDCEEYAPEALFQQDMVEKNEENSKTDINDKDLIMVMDKSADDLVVDLLGRFSRGSLDKCQLGDNSEETQEFLAWYDMLKADKIAVEWKTPKQYWDFWVERAEALYQEEGYLFFILNEMPMMARYIAERYHLQVKEYCGVGFSGIEATRAFVVQEQFINMDGKRGAECVQLLHSVDNNGQNSFLLRVIGDGKTYDTHASIRWDPSIWINDMDKDGVYEVFLTGDVASDDYNIYGWKYTGQELQPLGCENGFLMTGEIVSEGDNKVVVAGNKNILSSLFVREYAYSIEMGLSPIFTEKIELEPMKHRCDLECDLDVVSNGQSVKLLNGTAIWICGYDGNSIVSIMTESGSQYDMNVKWSMTEGDREGCWYINGSSENVCFSQMTEAG